MSNFQFDTDLLSLLPPWYRDLLDYQEICSAESEQFEALAQQINAVADNFFFQTMDSGALSQWEQILGITPTPSDTRSFRQVRLLNRLSTQPPFTLQFLHQKLDELIGPNAWVVTVDYPHYTLYIESAAQNQSYATEVAFTVNKIKPAHIVYINKPYTVSGLLLAETISLSQRIYNYQLGGWGLGINPFASETPQGVIKTAATPSVQSALLEGVANFLSSDVASARINGSIPVPAISKNVSGSTLTITYTVPESAANVITEAALLDSSGQVLTQSTVYVPVTGSTVLTHKIPISEGVISNA